MELLISAAAQVHTGLPEAGGHEGHLPTAGFTRGVLDLREMHAGHVGDLQILCPGARGHEHLLKGMASGHRLRRRFGFLG